MNKIKRYYFKEIDSTNEFAKKISKETSQDILIVSEKQTAGKGRMGRSFHSPEGGIYMSLLLHPDTTKNPLDITVMASVAVSGAIESLLGVKAYIKWVNDIYVDNKKVCGILTEGSFNTEKKAFDYAVLGVGINLFRPKGGFPDDIKNIAGSLTETGKAGLKERLIDVFLENFFEIYNGGRDYMTEYKARSNVLGKNIEYIKNGIKYKAKAVDILNSGELLVETESGMQTLNSGEIKICTESIV